jgi:hypothetical protein
VDGFNNTKLNWPKIDFLSSLGFQLKVMGKVLFAQQEGNALSCRGTKDREGSAQIS